MSIDFSDRSNANIEALLNVAGFDPNADPAVAANAMATLRLVDEQLTTNRLLVALVDQLGSLASVSAPMNYPVDPAIRIRDYAPDSDWSRIDESQDAGPEDASV